MTQEFPGVRVRRRLLLGAAAAAPALAALHACAAPRIRPTEQRARDAPSPSPLPLPLDEAPLNMDAFVAQWGARADALTDAANPDEDAFLHALLAGLHTLNRDALPARVRTVFDRDGLRTGPVAGSGALQVLEIELDPGAIIRPHNHVGYCFASVGMAGSALAQHFEVEGAAPPPGANLEAPFFVREVASTWLTPGRTTTLTRGRANIHMFRAGPEGATLLDVGVKFDRPGPGPRAFSVLHIDDAPTDVGRRVYRAKWLGNIYAKRPTAKTE